jgi:beta-lactam-binding protein with PASTA domain
LRFRAVQARLANMTSQRKFRQQITEGKRERETPAYILPYAQTQTQTMSDADRNAGQEARKQRHGDRGDDKRTGTQPQVFRLQICDFWS